MSKRTGISIINKAMEQKYGKGAFVLRRSGAGYYYWMGTDSRSVMISSVYVFRLEDDDYTQFVIAEAVREIEAQ